MAHCSAIVLHLLWLSFLAPHPQPTVKLLTYLTLLMNSLFPTPSYAIADTRCAEAAELEVARVSCPFGTVVSKVVSASYGTPEGQCGETRDGACASPTAKRAVEDICLGEASCDVSASSAVLGDPCPGTAKKLHIYVECQGKAKL